jgi:hypothetical protein
MQKRRDSSRAQGRWPWGKNLHHPTPPCRWHQWSDATMHRQHQRDESDNSDQFSKFDSHSDKQNSTEHVGQSEPLRFRYFPGQVRLDTGPFSRPLSSGFSPSFCRQARGERTSFFLSLALILIFIILMVRMMRM